jgi:hypothetical protein
MTNIRAPHPLKIISKSNVGSKKSICPGKSQIWNCTNELFDISGIEDNEGITPLRTEVYICHQNAKNIGNFMTLLKPHNIGTHLKGIETSFQVVPLFFEILHFWVSYITF